VRWLSAGIVFMGLNTIFLKALVGWFGWSVALGTVGAAEISTVLRYLVNDRWVFGHRRPSWMRLLKFEVANAGSLVIWWVATNLLVRAGINYLLAGLLAIGASTGFSLASSFYWIWRRRQPVAGAEPMPDPHD
jgi:putative flippase GtrA